MALAATTVWEVRTDGDDTNGGGFNASRSGAGTDYTYPSPAVYAYTDLVIQATTTQVASVARPFVAADVGNIVNVTGGTGFTTGRYEVVSVATGVATLDRSVGTAASTGGTARLGGAMATPHLAAAAAADDNAVFIRSGTYTVSVTGTAAPGGSRVRVVGYDSTRTVANTDATMPTIQSGANGVRLWAYTGGGHILRNIVFDGRYPTYTCTGYYAAASLSMIDRCVFKRISGAPIQGEYGNNPIAAHNCWFDANRSATSVACINCVFSNYSASSCTIGAYLCGCLFTGVGGSAAVASLTLLAIRCAAYGNTTSGAALQVRDTGAAVDCVAYGNTGAGFSGGLLVACAAGSNGTDFSSPRLQIGSISLGANPFANPAGGDYSLNSSLTGGGLLKGAGWPERLGLPNTAIYGDVGPYQSRGGGIRTVDGLGGFNG